MVAGGANFPAGRPWEGGRKVWHDGIFFLGADAASAGAQTWRRVGRLPRPLAADRDRLDVSFSGLKTALRYLVRPPGAAMKLSLPVITRLVSLVPAVPL
jgi:hypothetical protein